MDEDILLTRKEVMKLLRISHDTLHRLMKEGLLVYIKLEKSRRGKVLFRRSDIDAFLESKTIRLKPGK